MVSLDANYFPASSTDKADI
jgi:hypothetical protein